MLSSSDNRELLLQFTEADVFQAIKDLSRHKSAGTDGLNNDSYKDKSELLVPALVKVSNPNLNGSNMPPSL